MRTLYKVMPLWSSARMNAGLIPRNQLKTQVVAAQNAYAYLVFQVARVRCPA